MKPLSQRKLALFLFIFLEVSVLALGFYGDPYLHSLPEVHTKPGRETFRQNGSIGVGLGKM